MFYIGALFISVIGTLLHFVYEFSGHNKTTAIFAAVNESTWEHIKICLTATIIWSLFDGFIYGINSNYLIAKSLSLLTIILVIPVFFYTYKLFLKKEVLWIDISSFYITIILSQLVFYYFLNIDALPFIYTYLCSILLFIEISAYALLTYKPLRNFIFEDPISHKYGIEGHTEIENNNHHKK